MENAKNVTEGNINGLPQQQHQQNLMSENKNFLNSSQVTFANPNPNNLISHGANPALSDVDRPPHSYIALISMAILSKPERKILLNEIYDWVIQNFPYYQFRTDKSWRNSIRHNLSLNECFIKVGKAGNGRGYYWSIHGANMVDFKKGDFRRRQARLRAKHDKASSSKNSEGGSSKSKKSQQQQQQLQQRQQTDLLNSQVSINENQSQYPKTFSSPSLINQNQYSSYHYQSQQPQQQQQQTHQQSNLNLLANSQDYQNLSPQHNHQSSTNGSNLQYANSYQNMYQQTASKPIAQQLNSFNYNTLHQSHHEYPADLNGTYNQYSNEVSSSENTSLDSTSKFLSPTNSQADSFNESLLTKATSNTSSTTLGNQLTSKLQGSGSLSTSPSSSTSSTSSQSSQSQQYANYYANSSYHQTHSGQHTQNHSQSHLNHQQSSQYNAYLSNTFPWLPQASHSSSHGNMMAPQSNFLETLTSAASAASAVSNTVPPVVSSSAYDLNTFPYHNSQVHRI